MILLDTNVISEPLRPVPEVRVIQWLDAQPLETLYLAAITVAELRAGVALLPAGKRRAALQDSLEMKCFLCLPGASFRSIWRVPKRTPNCWPRCAWREVAFKLPMLSLPRWHLPMVSASPHGTRLPFGLPVCPSSILGRMSEKDWAGLDKAQAGRMTDFSREGVTRLEDPRIKADTEK